MFAHWFTKIQKNSIQSSKNKFLPQKIVEMGNDKGVDDIVLSNAA